MDQTERQLSISQSSSSSSLPASVSSLSSLCIFDNILDIEETLLDFQLEKKLIVIWKKMVSRKFSIISQCFFFFAILIGLLKLHYFLTDELSLGFFFFCWIIIVNVFFLLLIVVRCMQKLWMRTRDSSPGCRTANKNWPRYGPSWRKSLR